MKLVLNRKAPNHKKSDLHQQQDRACLKYIVAEFVSFVVTGDA